MLLRRSARWRLFCLAVVCGSLFAQGAHAQHAASTNVSTTNGLAIYDSVGKYVGPIVQENAVALLVNNAYYRFDLTINGGLSQQDASVFQFYHSAADCSDSRYLFAYGVPPVGFASGGFIYIPSPTAAGVQSLQAVERFNSGDNIDAPGQCQQFLASIYAAPVLKLAAPSFALPLTVR